MSQWDKCKIGKGLDGANAEDVSRRQKYDSPPSCSFLGNTFILKYLKGIGEEKMSLPPSSLPISSAKCFLPAKAALYFTLKCHNFSDRRVRYVSYYSLHYHSCSCLATNKIAVSTHV